ncbi:MAG TPA: hypothetical protein VEC36_11880 [Patescibacteria group bacterium]|nr:hypothetical protein [Patescibacteria group bacterium]
MQILHTIINFFFLGVIIVFPILLLRFLKKYKKNSYLFFPVSLFLLGVLIFIAVWWFHTSDMMLLEYYGYNIDGMSEPERYGNVVQENLENVRSIEMSIMGIGWPLKAIFGYIIFIPYLLIVFLGDKLITSKVHK